MKQINLVQGSPEWLEFRRTKIGASDAPIIMGESPWKTPFELYSDKIYGVENFRNRAMQRGVNLEPLARKVFEETTAFELTPPMVVQSDEFDWMIASLDGINEESKIIVEIKCPGAKDHGIAKEGKIPPKYYPQLQHQLAVTGYKQLYYFSFKDADDFASIICERDQVYIDKLIEAEKVFVECLRANIPPKSSKDDYIEETNEHFIDLAEDYFQLQENIDELNYHLTQAQKEQEEIKDQLLLLSGGRRCKGGGIRINQVIRKGTIDYGAIAELKHIDIEKYRRPATTYWTFSSCGRD